MMFFISLLSTSSSGWSIIRGAPCDPASFRRTAILCSHEARLDVDGCLVTDRRMEALPIVEAFYPVDDIEFGLGARFVANAMEAFNFQSLEEAFDRGVIPTVGPPAHRLN